MNIGRCGNTAAASVPIALDELNRSGKIKPGDLVAMTAFGGGLSSAGCLLRW
jgi:3-oxoacyl-[acyl-carrier-protein] synthase-3